MRIEREALTMVYAFHKFHYYLLGNKFIFYMDHMALLYLVRKPQVLGIIARWLLLFLEYEFSIICKLRKFHFVADALFWMFDLRKENGVLYGTMNVLFFLLQLVIRNFWVLHYRKIYSSARPRKKEKKNLESFTLLFGTGQIVPSRLRENFEVLLLGLINPHSATRNAWGSWWWAIFIQNYTSQDLECKVLVAKNAQGCSPILPSLWQLLVNEVSNTKQHNKIGNFTTSRTLHEMGIGFC